MFDAQARAFLQQALVARLAVIDGAGFPHVIPVWFMLDGDDVVFISARDTRKVGFIAANSKGAVVIGGDSGDAAGYMIKGELVVEPDPDLMWLKRVTRHYEPPEKAEKDIAEWAELDMIIIRLKPHRVIKVA